MKIEQNFIDKTISFFNPLAGFARAKARFATEALRSYEGASKAARTKNWKTQSTSANTEVQGALITLRNRSRDLTRNNPYAKKALQVLSTSVVGAGIRPKVEAGKTDKKRITALWKTWAETTRCDFDSDLTIYGIQQLIVKSYIESGEVLIRRRRVNNEKHTPIPLQIQVVESDLLDVSKSINLNNGAFIRQGIEFDSSGKKVAYWMFNSYPNEYFGSPTSLSVRIPIDDIIHVFEKTRPGQLRGVPANSSAMIRLRDFDEYEDAQLVRQKIAACFAVFVQDSSSDLTDGIAGTESEDDGTLSERVQPGLIEHLPPGKTISFATPPATTGYGEYSKNILRSVANSYGITYESLTGDLSNVNFTSYKAGHINQQLNVESIQNNVLIPALNKVWAWFIDASVLKGVVKSSDIKASWTPPRREMVDPLREIKGMSEEVRNGFTSWTEAVTSRGWDADELLIELGKDSELFDQFKLMLTCDPRYDSNRPLQPVAPIKN
jgi:lambda family phage portal protein